MCNPSTLNYSAQIKDELEAPKILRFAFLKSPAAPTSRFQAEIRKARRADGDVAGSGGSYSLWHDESGSQPVPLPGKKSTVNCQCGTIIVVLIPKIKFLISCLLPFFLCNSCSFFL